MSAMVYLTGGEIALVEQAEIHDAEDAMRLVVEAAKGVGQVAILATRERAPEMPLLAQLRALVGHLPVDPLEDVVFSAWIGRAEFAGLLGEVGHDRAGLEDRDRLAAAHRFVIDDRRHAAVRGNLQELRG